MLKNTRHFIEDKKRFTNIDNLRGTGIVLVVIGHLLQGQQANFFFLLYKFIYSFHMPLFFFISGLLFTPYESQKIFSIALREKMMRLIIPFFLWYLVNYSFNYKDAFIPFFKKLILSPDNGLWFLWILFFIYLVNLILLRTASFISSKKELPLFPVYLILAVLFFGLTMPIKFSLLGFSQFKYHFLYFVFGSFVTYYKNKIFHPLIITLSLITVVFLEFFYLKENFGFLKFLCGFFIPFLLFIIVTRENKALKIIGKKTLEIYAIHFFFLNYLTLPLNSPVSIMSITKIFLSTVILLFGSIIISFSIKKIPIIGPLMLGEYKRT